MKTLWLLLLLLCAQVVSADEALVNVATWEVVVVKPDGATWSTKETNGVCYVVQWVDNEFEFTADPNANIVFPYAIYSNQTVVVVVTNFAVAGVRSQAAAQRRVMVERSAYKINPGAKSGKNKKLKKDSADFGKNIKIK